MANQAPEEHTETQATGRERRIHPRTETRLEASLACAEKELTGAVENIGAGGVFFATDNLEVLIEDNARVIVRFTLNRDGNLEEHSREGNVLRSERYFDGESVVRAFAIKFDALMDLTGVEIH